MKLLKRIVLLLLLAVMQLVSIGQNTIDELIKKRGEAVVSFDAGFLKQIPNLQSYSVDKVVENKAILYVNKKHYSALRKMEIPLKLEAIPSMREGIKMANSKLKAKEWNTYPDYQTYLDLMEQFVADYPELCTIDTIGYSVEDRLLLALKISDNVTTDESEPEFFFSSSMHGDELAGYVLMLRMADYLLSNYSQAEVKNLVDNLEIYINPLANPDGTFAGGNNSVYGATRFNSNYIDINRNFKDPDDGDHPDGNSWQAETVAMMDYAFERDFILSMNFHGGIELLNYPWDTYYARHPDDNWFKYICQEYVDTVHAIDPYYMTDLNNGITNGYDWYPVAGGRQDFYTYFAHCREVTSELSTVKLVSASELPELWDNNYRSLLNYIEQATFGISGTVKNAEGDLLHAKVYIDGHDDDSSHVWTDKFGMYYRLIESGTHNVIFEAEGYDSQTISIAVQNNKKVVQNVILEKHVEKAQVVLTTNASNPTNVSPVKININFSSAISGFDINDLSTTNATVSNLQELTTGTEWSADVAPINNGTVIIRVDEDVVDEGNEPSEYLYFVYDDKAPENEQFDIIDISSSSFTARIEFNESGVLYYAGGLYEGTLPTVEMVIDGSGFEFSGDLTLTANEQIDVEITGLSSESSYGMFLVAVDALGNKSDVYVNSFQTLLNRQVEFNRLNVFPNPADEVIYIKTENDIEELTFVGIDGKKHLIEMNIVKNRGFIAVDVQNLDPGVYFISGESESQPVYGKVIIE